ncbi:flagellar brake domain-containing protein [Bacillaceae bacterium]
MLPKISQFIFLEEKSAEKDGGEAPKNGSLKSRVANVTDDHIEIEIPLDEQHGKFETFLPGDELFVRYVGEDGAQYEFSTVVTGKRMENVPLLILAKPEAEKITRKQRRQYFRIPAVLPIRVKTMRGNDEAEVSAQTVDISGGGLAFHCDPSIPFQVGEPLSCILTLAERGTGGRELTFTAEVVRIRPPEELPNSRQQLVSVQISEIREAERDMIIRFCFQRQVELRKKGIL